MSGECEKCGEYCLDCRCHLLGLDAHVIINMPYLPERNGGVCMLGLSDKERRELMKRQIEYNRRSLRR
jgi:hypothetical protein